VFCTTGVLLQKLINRHNLDEFTHIILDEVHERNKEMDFVMLLVRKYQLKLMKNVKVNKLIMSH
jgi:ATP-dependent RNA helicase TDRD9